MTDKKDDIVCTYAGKEYSEGAELCQVDRIMVCEGGSWRDTGRDCGSLESIDDLQPFEQFDGDEIEEDAPLLHDDVDPLRTYTKYSLRRNMYTRGDRVYGRFDNSIANVCIGNGLSGYINQIQIDSMTSIGSCSRKEVIKIVYNG